MYDDARIIFDTNIDCTHANWTAEFFTYWQNANLIVIIKVTNKTLNKIFKYVPNTSVRRVVDYRFSRLGVPWYNTILVNIVTR